MWYQSLAFWKAVSLIIAVAVGIFTDYKLEAAVVEGVVFAVLELLGVKLELTARGLKK